jgi:hypothetical protein
MTITEPGEYRMRNGEKVVVEFRTAADDLTPWIGYIVENSKKTKMSWRESGNWTTSGNHDYDIVDKWNYDDGWLPEGCKAIPVETEDGVYSAGGLYIGSWLTRIIFVAFAYRDEDGQVFLSCQPVLVSGKADPSKRLQVIPRTYKATLRPFAVVMRDDD